VYTVTQCAQISRPQSIGVCVWLRNSNSIWYINVKEKENLYFPTRLVCIINWSLTTIVYSLETGFVVAVVCCSESRDWIRLVIVRHSVTWEALIISREQAWCFVIEIRKNILGWPGNKDGLWFYRHFPKKIKRHLTRIGVDLPSNGKLKKKVFSFVQIFFSRWQYILPCTVNNLMLYDITWRCIETSVSAGWRFPLFFFRSVGRSAIIPFRNLLSVFLFPLLFLFPSFGRHISCFYSLPARLFLVFFIVRYMYMYIGLDQLRSILHCPPSGRYVLFLPTKHKLRLLFSRLRRPAGQTKVSAFLVNLQYNCRNNIATTFEL
jgi:hypothetical protein